MVSGGITPTLFELYDSHKQIYKVRFNVETQENGGVSFIEETFNYKPSLSDIKTLIIDWYNEQCTNEIVKGFSYNNIPVWLSRENQSNFIISYSVALQRSISSLEYNPVKFKLGTDDNINYTTFSTFDELKSFIESMYEYIKSVLSKYWELKEGIDWSKYE